MKLGEKEQVFKMSWIEKLKLLGIVLNDDAFLYSYAYKLSSVFSSFFDSNVSNYSIFVISVNFYV